MATRGFLPGYTDISRRRRFDFIGTENNLGYNVRVQIELMKTLEMNGWVPGGGVENLP